MSKAVAKIKHALNHDLTQLPGKLKKLEERTVDGVTGIYFESKMADTTLGNDTLKNYLEGIYDNHSIGFQYVNVEMIERGADGFKDIVDSLVNAKEAKDREAIFVVKEIALFEGSTVAFGANMNTPFLGVKGLNKDAISVSFLSRLSKLEKALRSGTQSDETMKMFELQVLQIKQAFMELNQLWTIKETPKPITTSNVIEAGKGLISEELIKNFSLK